MGGLEVKQERMTVAENRALTDSVFRMRLTGDTSAISRPGQFVNLKLEGFFLRRPISVCDWDEDSLTLIYKVVGRGTDAMAQLRPGAELDVLIGLGNGYDLSKAGPQPLLVGGGVGVPPLYGLAKRLTHCEPTVVLGFNTASEVFAQEAFEALGVRTILCTADGSRGVRGFVTDALPESYSYFYACGPLPMLRALHAASVTSGQLSLEERMGCGFGACVGCTVQTTSGRKRVCRDDPVMEKEDLLW